MGRHLRVSVPHSSRSFSFSRVRWRFAVVLFVIVLFQQSRLFVHRQSLAAKYASTEFHDATQTIYTHAGNEGGHHQDTFLAHREAWRTLGEGWEGKVFANDKSVIKTFTPGRSPFRNCAPGNTSEKWPTEIAASIRFGGTSVTSRKNNTDKVALEGFLPVEAYFKASASPQKLPEWHLVTPLLTGGNLNTLAKKVVQEDVRKTFREVDAYYRPVFEQLLSNIQRLHKEGYCHDDIKPANIFVRHESRWVLGDLGNVRHITHPYHSSRLWLDNQQLGDCRANDVMRLLKSYLKFIQMSARNTDDFNEAFFKGKEPTSRVFWQASTDAPNMNAAQLLKLSHVEHPKHFSTSGVDDSLLTPTVPSSLLALFSQKLALQYAVDHVIETRMGEKLARWWAMVAVFGVPTTENCGV